MTNGTGTGAGRAVASTGIRGSLAGALSYFATKHLLVAPEASLDEIAATTAAATVVIAWLIKIAQAMLAKAGVDIAAP